MNIRRLMTKRSGHGVPLLLGVDTKQVGKTSRRAMVGIPPSVAFVSVAFANFVLKRAESGSDDITAC